LGSFFLFAAAAMFLAGLGALTSLLSSTLRHLKAHRVTSIYFQRRSSGRKRVLIFVGLGLILAAQGCYWFYSQANQFVILDDSVPQLQIEFIYESDHKPRVTLTTHDSKSQVNSQTLPVLDRQLYITSEVIEWEKLFELLGMRDCYQFTGVFYGDIDSARAIVEREPHYDIGWGPSGLVSVISYLQAVFPARAQVVISPPLQPGPGRSYVLELAADSLYSLREVDNIHAADYSR
jgi:hypothetical protein